jgi:hypothetical protein
VGVSGAEVYLKRSASVPAARQEFTQTCDNGWRDDDWNRQYRKRITYGGEQDNRFCASAVVEWRYDLTSLCVLSGNRWSYMIFQKGNVLIAIYENETGGLGRTGTYTNEAIHDLANSILNE